METNQLDAFLDYVAKKNLELYPAQEEAVLELLDGKNVILNTPTGSGKSLVAAAVHFASLNKGERSAYTSPIKALVNEKFLALCHDFGAQNVGLVTGDASVNRTAPIICCTAEILSNICLSEGEKTPFRDVVMDEFHYYSDRTRGVAWQIPLLTLKNSRFLLMSATLADMDPFLKAMTDLNGLPSVLVQSKDRPVPLDFLYKEIPLHETIAELVESNRAPVYLVSFTQRECAEAAQSLLSTDVLSKEQKKQILEEIKDVKFSSPYGKELARVIKHGIGIHHAGLLPRYRLLVERLAQKGLLKIICGTDTLGVGVNIPIRTVLFTKLCKYDGEKTAILSVRDFQQIAGRAGRKGFDDQGYVVAQAPEHVVENLRLEAKAAGDPKKLRKIVKRQPPPRGFVPFEKTTFERLINGKPEPLVSRFNVTHGMLLHVLSRSDDDGCKTMRKLIGDSFEKPQAKKQHRKAGFQLFRSLLERNLISYNGKAYKVNVDLQAEFSLNQTLSLYLIDTLALLDPMSETYPLDVLTLVESILENPDVVLRKQLDRVKTEKIRELKEAGVEYEERMEQLELLEHPKPNRDFIYDSFNRFTDKHPWIGNDNIKPKSVAREMYEYFLSFDEYIREYELQRSEGLLLRYLSDVYKALLQTVPEQFKNEEIDAITAYFGSMIRRIDSSLLEEWEKMKDPLGFEQRQAEGKRAPPPPDADAFLSGVLNPRTLNIQLRNEVFSFIRYLSTGMWENAIELIHKGGADESETEWTEPRLETVMKEFWTDHGQLLTTARARFAEFTKVDRRREAEGVWEIEQFFVDSNDFNDWSAKFEVLLKETKSEGHPVLRLLKLGPA